MNIINRGKILKPSKDEGEVWTNGIIAAQQQTESEYIPKDPQEFYEDFGGVRHPNKKDQHGNPVFSTQLTQYQITCWKYPGNLAAIKGNKIGLTTSFSLEDFQSRLLPEEAGFDCLLVAQSDFMARQHISDLKTMIRGSKKYSKYLIESQSRSLMAEQKSKVSEAWIANPYNPSRPSRIIGIGSTPTKAYSWKNINRIHMSDVSLLKTTDQALFFGALYSRLTNQPTGVVKIESVPNGQMGEVWNIYNKSKVKTSVAQELSEGKLAEDPEKMASMFKVLEIPTREAIPYGLVTQQKLDELRRQLGDLVFEQLYECRFHAPGNQFYKPEWFSIGDYIL